jgi:hypothetical protein
LRVAYDAAPESERILKFLKSPASAIKSLIRHQAVYAAHPDPAAFAVNKIALILAWNGPFYPLYVLLLAGHDALPWCVLTMLATPFFYAVPWVSRRISWGGRIALPLVGAVNTLWCIKLFGVDSGVGLFLYPCLILPALLFHRRERWLMLPLLGLIFLFEFIPPTFYGAPVMALTAQDSARLSGLNEASVAALLCIIAIQFADVFRSVDSRQSG